MMIDKLKQKYSKTSFTPKEALELGVSARMLNHLHKRGEIEKISRGLYALSGVDTSGEEWSFYDLATVAKSYKGAVVCLISALNYWEITEEFARVYWLAFPNNHPPVKNKMVRMYRPRNLETGVIEIKLSGVVVKITDPERSLVDAFKSLDEESAITSLRLYLDQEDVKINISKLVSYSVKLKEHKLLRILTEIASSQARSYPALKDKAFRDTVQEISKMRKKIYE
jgi:predicted transcriptional regulator of viral defense system